jgi:2-polyprenyl-3-methyl-5-hydroxy-6-metoxy-1,4-benzoquinol methylase
MSSLQPRHLCASEYGSDEASPAHAYLDQPILRLLASLPGAPSGIKVLDAGCGNGSLARQLSEKGFDVVGMDLEESGIVQARRSCPSIRFEVASVYDNMSSLFGRQFDAVVSLEVIEHLYDPRQFVTRVQECLRPGGMFVLSTPYHGYLKNVLIALAGEFDAHTAALVDGGHIKFWSQRTLSSLLEQNGFRVNSFIGAGRLPYLWKSMILAATRL